MSRPSISGYTTTYNCIEKHYPFEECIRSLLGFCDEVCVADAGSTDGTLEKLHALQSADPRIKISIEPVDFSHPRWAIHQDGLLKAKARAMCSKEFCWQTDTDEIVSQNDYAKIFDFANVMKGASCKLLMLPMVEFWGSLDRIRGDFFSWKLRLSLNDPNITHGIPKHLRMTDSAGNLYPRPFDSDSCNYIFKDSETDVPYSLPSGVDPSMCSSLPDAEYEKLYFQWLETFPSVLHVSWLDLPRKISHYRDFWPKFHASMYNLDPNDVAENNVMFDKPWSSVSEQDILDKAKQLKEIGPRSFHHKINPLQKGRTFWYKKELPAALRNWADKEDIGHSIKNAHPTGENFLTVEAPVHKAPLVSCIVTCFNKEKYLEEAVQSLLNQSYEPIELVIVDDGSSDNSVQVAQSIIQNSEKTIKLIVQKNGGVSSARNIGIQNALGEYVLLLDGDDLADSRFIERGMEKLKEGYNLFCSDVGIFGDTPGQWIPNPYSLLTIRYDNSIPSLALFRKELWEKSEKYQVSILNAEDWVFWVSCSKHNLNVYQCREKLFRYRANETGLASNYSNNRHKDCQASVTFVNDDLFSVEECIDAHKTLADIADKFKSRLSYLVKVHPQDWRIRFRLGLLAEAADQKSEAIRHYCDAKMLPGGENWQLLLRLGLMYIASGATIDAWTTLREARRLRPDLTKVIEPFMIELDKAVTDFAQRS